MVGISDKQPRYRARKVSLFSGGVLDRAACVWAWYCGRVGRFCVEFEPVEAGLRSLVARFPSESQVALVHDAEEKLRVALEMWLGGEKDVSAALLVRACTHLYDFADAVSRPET